MHLQLQKLLQKNKHWAERQPHQSACLNLVTAPLTFTAVCQACPSSARARAVVRCHGTAAGVSTGCGPLCIDCDERLHSGSHYCHRTCIIDGVVTDVGLGTYLVRSSPSSAPAGLLPEPCTAEPPPVAVGCADSCGNYSIYVVLKQRE